MPYPKKPNKLKILEGNRGHETKAQLAKRATEPEPIADIGRMPKGMPLAAARKWKEIVRGWSTVPGLMTAVDNAGLEAACRAYAQAVRYDREVDRLQRLVAQGKAGKEEISRLSVVNSCSRNSWNQYGKFATEFGCTPASRARLQGLGDAPPASGPRAKMSAVEAALCG